MRISVYNIYILALLVAIGAATLSGVVLSSTFAAQQAESEKAQANSGLGQVHALQTIVDNQMTRMSCDTVGNIRQFLVTTWDWPDPDFSPEVVIDSLNKTMFDWWPAQVRAPNQVNGFGLYIIYPNMTNQSTGEPFGRGFECYSDTNIGGAMEYAYSYTNLTDGLLHAHRTVWPSLGTPELVQDMYSYDPFSDMASTFDNQNYYDFAYPWSSSDGNSYWYFTHMNAITYRDLVINVQTWDVAIQWPERMQALLPDTAEFIVVDSNDMVIGTTIAAEAARLAQCHGQYIDGVIPSECISTPASQHPIAEIRNVCNALTEPSWYNLSAPAIPFATSKFDLNGTAHMAIVGTLFFQNNSRMTVIWYEPWVHMSGNVISLSALICIMTVVSTITLSVMGILGILHPLMKLGQSMRMVAENLKDSDGAIDEVAVEMAKRSPFTEVEAISRDFETIVIDFLGFSCAKTRNNLHAPKDASHPFAVVFTDIQSSTGLWGKDPVAMGRCIQSHHLLMRTLIDVHRLYEVKTVGDSFMATTDCAPNAVNFAIDIQVTLFEHDWGWDGADGYYQESSHVFLKTPKTSRIDPAYSDIWNGLRVRIGIHYGKGDITYDEVTKGYDYYGTVVNAAARIEALGHGGQILVSDAVVSAMTVPLDLSVAAISPLGQYPLRGLQHPMQLFQVQPARLAGRIFPPPRVEAPEKEVGAASTPKPLTPHRSGSQPLTDRASHHTDRGMPPILEGAVGVRRRPSLSSALSRSTGSLGRNPEMVAEEVARGHSTVRSGVLPVDYVAKYLLKTYQNLEDFVMPLPNVQQTTVYKALAKGWGVAPPRGKTDFPLCGLRMAQRVCETPKALLELQARMPAHVQAELNMDLLRVNSC